MTRPLEDAVIFARGQYRVRVSVDLTVVEKQNPVSRIWHIVETFVSAPHAIEYAAFVAKSGVEVATEAR